MTRMARMARMARTARMAHGRQIVRTLAALAGVCAGTSAWGQNWVEEAILQAGSPGALENFGVSVDCEANTVAVGCWGDTVQGDVNAGSVFIFNRVNGVWTQTVRLVASDGAPEDRFGYRIALNAAGDQLVVGAPFADVNGIVDAGAAYVFNRVNGVWTETQKLTASDAAADDEFGSAVSGSGNILIGSPDEDNSGFTDNGSVYAFNRVNGVWTEAQKLLASDPQNDAGFGSSVSVDSGLAAVGAPLRTVNGRAIAGGGYIFRRTNGVWAQEAAIAPPVVDAGAGFGTSCDISGVRAIFGASSEDNFKGPAAGAAYIFVDEGAGVWDLEANIYGSGTDGGSFFGTSVRIGAERATIGAWQQSGALNAQGAVYVFERSGSSWTEAQMLEASDAQLGSGFGISVAVREGVLVAGAITHDVNGLLSAGQAYVFDESCPADFNGDGTADSDDFFDFLNAYNVADPAADFNGDGVVDSDDFFDFLNAYNAGC